MLDSLDESLSLTKSGKPQLIDFLDHLLHKEKEHRKLQLADRHLQSSKLPKKVKILDQKK